MVIRYTEDFKQEAVRLVEKSGRTLQEIAADLGIGKSTLGKWLRRCRALPGGGFAGRSA